MKYHLYQEISVPEHKWPHFLGKCKKKKKLITWNKAISSFHDKGIAL